MQLKDKVIFLDMDGTIVEYRSFDKVNCSLQECFLPGMYVNCRPLLSVINKIKNSGYRDLYILSKVQCSINIDEKREWLHKYVPFVADEKMLFICDDKPLALDTYVHHFGLEKEDVVFIDDTVEYLEKAEDMGYVSYHISSLVD